jgi:hypothetical protein
MGNVCRLLKYVGGDPDGEEAEPRLRSEDSGADLRGVVETFLRRRLVCVAGMAEGRSRGE